ncbi:hypothetical protein PsYK624_131980 [Phanerochaete sordida]|uniref:Histone deacetylase domain-containing protein n=1 Tax=Phanerochaete sordida TaxID=48140 RepID=A0A9P3LJ76_9APHY|nr:hypothetical protein PsYK624_131980 [Phanerochaete sordida]
MVGAVPFYVSNVLIWFVPSRKAYRKHGVKRVVLFDIDLHHGDGTQRLVLGNRLGPSFFYGGIHDAKSFPGTSDEGKNEALVQVSMGERPKCLGIHNVPLRAHRKPKRFWEAYETTYSTILARAIAAVQASGDADDVLVIISCGFDASEHEDPDISLGKVHIPTEFYRRFTAEACAFADKYASGRLVSVLEGGYSDRALISGTMAHVGALAEAGGATVDPKWWEKSVLDEIAACTLNSRVPEGEAVESWLKRTRQISRGLLVPSVASKPAVSLLSVPHTTPPFSVARRPPTRMQSPIESKSLGSLSSAIQAHAERFDVSVTLTALEGSPLSLLPKRSVSKSSPAAHLPRQHYATSSTTAPAPSTSRPSVPLPVTSVHLAPVHKAVPLHEPPRLHATPPFTLPRSAANKRPRSGEDVVSTPAKKSHSEPRGERVPSAAAGPSPLPSARHTATLATLEAIGVLLKRTDDLRARMVDLEECIHRLGRNVFQQPGHTA